MPDKDRAMDAREAADLLGVHAETIRRLSRKGGLPCFKVGKDWRYHASELRRWASEHPLRVRQAVILVVDDEAAITEVMAEYIEGRGHRALVAHDGVEALELLKHEVVSFVILDLVMPGMDGVECLLKIREEHPGMPVALMTGLPDKDMILRAAEHGPCLLMVKPVDVTHLDQALKLGLAHQIRPGS